MFIEKGKMVSPQICLCENRLGVCVSSMLLLKVKHQCVCEQHVPAEAAGRGAGLSVCVHRDTSYI